MSDLFIAKVVISHWEDVEKVVIILAKSSYKPNIKYISLIILLYFGYTFKTKHRNIENFTSFSHFS
jgi:hypothetical protein